MSTAEAVAAPALYPLTSDNHAGVVVLAAVIFLIYALLGFASKLIIRLNITSLKLHDLVLLVGVVLYFIETVCIIVACNHGLGQHEEALSSGQLEMTSKLIYVSRILAVLLEACTKISICLLIRNINSGGLLNTANLALAGLIIAWAVSGFFALVFQCPLPSPWLAESKAQCPGFGPIYVYNGVMSILTDLALCIVPVAMMWEVHTTLKRKIVVVALFGTRIIVPILTIPSLTTARHVLANYTDATWALVPSLIWMQVVLGLSVLTACIPSLKGIVDSLLGATAVAAVQAPYGLRSGGKNTGIELTALPEQSGSKQGGSSWGGRHQASAGHSHNHVHGHSGTQQASSDGDGGAESIRGLTEGVVHVYDEFEVQYDDQDHKRLSASHDGSQESSVAAYHQHV